jgi:hypothetical protein
VAAALASQAFGSRAGAVPGVYGVAMLLAGSVTAGALGRARRRRLPRPRPRRTDAKFKP